MAFRKHRWRRFSLFLTGALIAVSAATAPVPASAEWQASVGRDPPSVHLNATARDGVSRLDGGCNNLLEPGFIGTISGYSGRALKRIDEGEEPLGFEISGPGGTSRFEGRVWYMAHERAWPLTDPLPPAFFEKLAEGSTLTLRNARGTAVAVFDLKGAADAVRLVRQTCMPWSGR